MPMKIQRLNMDNTWFIEFAGLRMLIDPWLFGQEVDFFSWFNTQWHRTAPVSLAEVPDFDLVLITQKYPDHFHQETLKKLQPKLVVGPQSIENQLNKILPDSNILSFNEGIHDIHQKGIRIHHLPSARKIDPIYDALVIENGEQSIFLASHGFTSIDQWQSAFNEYPPVHVMLSPFDHYQLPFFLGGTVAPGIEGLRKLAKSLNPTHIIATHDEDKHAKGLVSKFAKITKAPNYDKLQSFPELKNKILPFTNYKALEI